jgi:hypothetical protein
MVPRNDDKIVDGDILTINTDTGIQKYKYFVCPFGYSGWTSLMATGIIIRVQ